MVPRGRVPELFDVVAELKRAYGLRDRLVRPRRRRQHPREPDGRSPPTPDQLARATRAERELFERVVALEGSISGEHGIGFAKKAYLGLELSPDEIALMRRLKPAFDPHGILNPGKIFPD